MIPFKVKVKTLPEQSQLGNMTVGYVILHSISYSSTRLDSTLTLFDADGDQFMHKIPGNSDPRPISPENQILVKLPISYVDSPEGGNDLVVWGERVFPEVKPSGF